MNSEEERIKELIQFLNNRALNNSVRLAILIALHTFGQMTFSELLEYSQIPKSSLLMHLQILEEEGLAIIKKGFTVNGVRTFVKITDKGRETVKEYLRLIGNIS
ncbi:ArsR family transcriptional regulator [Sulfolobus sp. E5-1-F]|uniref:winged helix-turn-helix domain-containing protein n=1 Tax=Saccharolobus sp. E5-1-F TaxID=2663019 RepID=UPI001294D34C|nr:winged helix-turn-helix domain-containing protein [Sulfolobus sp. E5-1-F]QGA53696.1 ArsR family transcriptional regulator [Sulfolobus sp. E5-1-F]